MPDMKTIKFDPRKTVEAGIIDDFKIHHMNILGKLPESTSPSGGLDWPAIFKILRTTLVTGIAAALGSLTLLLPQLDPIKNTQLDTLVITLILIPLVETVRRWLADYSQLQ